MNLHEISHRIQTEAHTIVYAVVRGDALTMAAATCGVYLLAFAGLLNLFGVPLALVDAGAAAGLLGCGLAWVRALQPTLDRILTVAYLAAGAGFLAVLAQHRTTAAVVMLALIGAITIALTVHRIVRHRTAKRPGPGVEGPYRKAEQQH
jgi:hypothetical protein